MERDNWEAWNHLVDGPAANHERTGVRLRSVVSEPVMEPEPELPVKNLGVEFEDPYAVKFEPSFKAFLKLRGFDVDEEEC